MKNILTEALVNSATNASFIFSYTNSAKLRYKKNDNLLFVNKCKIISFLSCKFSENEYNNLHKQRREEVQK
jgi:hypothetical protein